MTQNRSERRARNGSVVAALTNYRPETDGAGRPKSGRETKKTYTLMFYPSVYENAKFIASLERRSVSDVMGAFLSQYVQNNQDKLPPDKNPLKR